MGLIVSDANIFIDMEVGGLTRLMFRMGEEIAVPDVLYEEELRQHHGDLPGHGLRIMEIRGEFMTEAVRLRAEYPAAGANDVLALALAKQERCPLLTGDAALRQAAQAEAVPVQGTLWIVGELFRLGLITHELATNAYARMKAEGRRLPWALVDEQLARL